MLRTPQDGIEYVRFGVDSSFGQDILECVPAEPLAGRARPACVAGTQFSPARALDCLPAHSIRFLIKPEGKGTEGALVTYRSLAG